MLFLILTHINEFDPTLLPKFCEEIHNHPQVGILGQTRNAHICDDNLDLKLMCGPQFVDQPTERFVKGSPVDFAPGDTRVKPPVDEGDLSNARRGDGRNNFRFLMSWKRHDHLEFPELSARGE